MINLLYWNLKMLDDLFTCQEILAGQRNLNTVTYIHITCLKDIEVKNLNGTYITFWKGAKLCMCIFNISASKLIFISYEGDRYCCDLVLNKE